MPGGQEESRLADVREYVADVVGCRADRVATVRRFEDGNRHDVYKASYLDAAGIAADLVVRVSLGDDRAEREQAEREALVLRKLAGVGAPQLIDIRLSNPWFASPVLSMQFVPGCTLELRSATSADIERLGSVVASVHAQPVEDLADSFAETGSILGYAVRRLQHILHGLPSIDSRKTRPRCRQTGGDGHSSARQITGSAVTSTPTMRLDAGALIAEKIAQGATSVASGDRSPRADVGRRALGVRSHP